MIIMNKIDEEIIHLYHIGWSRNKICKVFHIGHNYAQKIIQQVNKEYHHKEYHLWYLADKIRRMHKRAKVLKITKGIPYWSAYKTVNEHSFEGICACYNPHRLDVFIREGDELYEK